MHRRRWLMPFSPSSLNVTGSWCTELFHHGAALRSGAKPRRRFVSSSSRCAHLISAPLARSLARVLIVRYNGGGIFIFGPAPAGWHFAARAKANVSDHARLVDVSALEKSLPCRDNGRERDGCNSCHSVGAIFLQRLRWVIKIRGDINLQILL